MMKKFTGKRRESAPVLSFAGMDVKQERPNLVRRKSEGVVKIQQKQEPAIEKYFKRPSMPKCYIKGIDRERAESLLHEKPVGTFLLRDRQSSDAPGSYTLSMRDKDNQCRHFKIDTNPRNQKLAIAGYEVNQFESLEKVVAFFVKQKENEVPMRAYGQPDPLAGYQNLPMAHGPLYEEMDDDVSAEYQKMDDDVSPEYQQMEPVSPVSNKSESPVKDFPSPTSGFAQSPFMSSPKQNGRPPPTGMRQVDYENMSGKASCHPPPNQNYQNIGPRGGTRRPPPPEPPETIREHDYENIGEGNRSTTPPCPSRPERGPYQNIPSRNETVPLPPRRQPHISGTANSRRKGSLPARFESVLSGNPATKPPPLPSRPHVSTDYQNLPGRGSMTVDTSGQQRRRNPMQRSLTEPARDINKNLY